MAEILKKFKLLAIDSKGFDDSAAPSETLFDWF